MIINKDIDNGVGFDWGRASNDYAKYRDIYPPIFYKNILDLGLCRDGQRVLDIGTGTGVLPRNMYKYGAKFIGADISENQIAEAKRLSEGMDISYIVSPAESLEFPDASFDVITACQCFIYFDKPVLLPKIHRMLDKNGHFCILFMAWLPQESEIAAKSEELVLKYNPHWTDGGIKRHIQQIPDWAHELFVVENEIIFDLNVTFTRESWNGRIKACRGIGATSLTQAEKDAFEREHLEYLQTVPQTFDIIHFASILNLKKA